MHEIQEPIHAIDIIYAMDFNKGNELSNSCLSCQERHQVVRKCIHFYKPA